MVIDELHPLARDLLAAYSTNGYFRSVRLCHAVAELEPHECLAWATRLISPSLEASASPALVAEMFSLVKFSTVSPQTETLDRVDDLASQCWCSGSFDDVSPYLQRAVARLGWATLGLICLVNNATFASERVRISADACDDTALKTLVHESSSAMDMTLTGSDDGRLLVTAQFTHLMERIS